VPAKITSALLVFVFAVGTHYFLSPQLDSYSRQQRRRGAGNLSGRLPLWQDTWEMIRERPSLATASSVIATTVHSCSA